MKNIFILSTLYLILCTAGCTNKKEKFQLLLSKYPDIKLPLVIKACDLNPDSLSLVDSTTELSPFDKSVPAFCYGKFLTRENLYAVLTLASADCMLPMISMYDHEGKLIDSESLSIGYGGMDCGFSSEEFLKIGEDYSLYACDTILTMKCDSAGNVIPGTADNYLLFKEGKILSTGQVHLSEEKRKSF